MLVEFVEDDDGETDILAGILLGLPRQFLQNQGFLESSCLRATHFK